MNKFSIHFTLVLFSLVVKGQCPTDNLVFNSQQELNNFQLSYPNCKILDKNLTIEGNDITDLSALDSIEVIKGELNILNNDELDSINGFYSLQRIEGHLSIQQTSLWYMGGLSNLKYVGGDFQYFNNQNGILDGLNGLDSIGGTVNIVHVLFSDFDGMNNIRYIGGGLRLSQCNVTDLNGLSKIESLGGDLSIQNCQSLSSLSGLSNLKIIDGKIILNHNLNLKFISGIRNIDYTTISELIISNNSELSTCEYENICNFLFSDGTNSIEDNDFGCNTAEEILSKCTVSNANITDFAEIELFPNPSEDYFNIKLKGKGLVRYKIFNNLGTAISTGEFMNSFRIELINSKSGVYWLTLSTDDWHTSLKLVKI